MSATTTKRAAFDGGLLGSLRAKMDGAASTQKVLQLKIGQIEPDQNQPRQTFDQGSLDGLAASIRMVGVLQPIGVKAVDGSHYRIVFGERRWRASQLAGVETIPAVIVPDSDNDTLTTQVIENQHRKGLSNKDIADVIEKLADAGLKNAAIADVVNINAQYLKFYRVVKDLPPAFIPLINGSHIRAVYELNLAYGKADDDGKARIEQAARDFVRDGYEGEITITGARRLLREADKSAGKASVYVIQRADGAVKVGWSANPSERLEGIARIIKAPVASLALVFHQEFDRGDATIIEKEAHIGLEDCALGNEWFATPAQRAVDAVKSAARVLDRARRLYLRSTQGFLYDGPELTLADLEGVHPVPGDPDDDVVIREVDRDVHPVHRDEAAAGERASASLPITRESSKAPQPKRLEPKHNARLNADLKLPDVVADGLRDADRFISEGNIADAHRIIRWLLGQDDPNEPDDEHLRRTVRRTR